MTDIPPGAILITDGEIHFAILLAGIIFGLLFAWVFRREKL